MYNPRWGRLYYFYGSLRTWSRRMRPSRKAVQESKVDYGLLLGGVGGLDSLAWIHFRQGNVLNVTTTLPFPGRRRRHQSNTLTVLQAASYLVRLLLVQSDSP